MDTSKTKVKTTTEKVPKVCLVLQGGGALGAYHIGAYEALVKAGLTPDCFAGISIGAFNAAILAGNKPEKRLEKLEKFWNSISYPGTDTYFMPDELISLEMKKAFSLASVSQSLMMGQPNFFSPRSINPLLAPEGEGATSFYDTAPLYSTLNDVVDFDLINQGKARLIVEATNVKTGKLEPFDSLDIIGGIKAEHIVASGSLPPGFPATKIGNEYYWDGGVVSNTPLNQLLHEVEGEDEDLLIFVLDLWNPKGEFPQTISEVLWRQKEIQYASRTCEHITALKDKYNLAHYEQHGVGDKQALKDAKKIDIVHLTFNPLPGHNALSDTDFSRRSIRLRSEKGYDDMQRAMIDKPWEQSCNHLPARFFYLLENGKWAPQPCDSQLVEQVSKSVSNKNKTKVKTLSQVS